MKKNFWYAVIGFIEIIKRDEAWQKERRARGYFWIFWLRSKRFRHMVIFEGAHYGTFVSFQLRYYHCFVAGHGRTGV